MPPNMGWIRLNTDGASKQGIVAGCGGVFEGRTESGFVVFRRGWELVVHVLQSFGGC